MPAPPVWDAVNQIKGCWRTRGLAPRTMSEDFTIGLDGNWNFPQVNEQQGFIDLARGLQAGRAGQIGAAERHRDLLRRG
jgi:hypothetical protein